MGITWRACTDAAARAWAWSAQPVTAGEATRALWCGALLQIASAEMVLLVGRSTVGVLFGKEVPRVGIVPFYPGLDLTAPWQLELAGLLFLCVAAALAFLPGRTVRRCASVYAIGWVAVESAALWVFGVGFDFT